MDYSLKALVRDVNYKGLQEALTQNPSLANEGISLDDNATTEHPLHRICDGVFHGLYSDEEAAEMAKIFLSHGARVDGNGFKENKDTPLVAAASLQSDAVALLYIDHGANIHHRGCHGGTALHWAAWCGRDKIVTRLLREKPDVNALCVDFKSTPLFWGIHGYKFGGVKNRHNQLECVRQLLHAGADKTIPNFEGYLPVELLGADDAELANVLK
jgi:uncharacterized protein